MTHLCFRSSVIECTLCSHESVFVKQRRGNVLRCCPAGRRGLVFRRIPTCALRGSAGGEGRYDEVRRGGRVADRTGLETRQHESVRGFESLPLRFTPQRLTAMLPTAVKEEKTDC